MLQRINQIIIDMKNSGVINVKTDVHECYTCTRVHARESEKDLEARLVKEVSRRGGMAIKLTSQFHKGLPDRLVLVKGRPALFAEIKTTGKKRTKLQELAGAKLEELGFSVAVIDCTEDLNQFIDAL